MNIRKNIVSSPPIQNQLIDSNGLVSRAWGIWFRDIFARTSFKGGNSIDDNINSIIAVDATTQENTANILANKSNIDINTSQISANTSNISQNSIDITANTINIADNTNDIATNVTNIATNAGNIATNADNIVIANQNTLNLEHRAFGDVRPSEYSETIGYTKGEYVVFPNADIQNYYIAIVDISSPSGVFDSSKWKEVSLNGIIDNFVRAGYGSISYASSYSLSDISAGSWQTLLQNNSVLTVPFRVSYDFTTYSMLLYESGIWMCSVNVSLEFDSDVSIRYLQLRVYNVTKSTVSSRINSVVVPSGSDAANISFSFPIEVADSEKVDKFVIQISGNATFQNVVQNDTLWSVNRISKII